MLHNPSDGPSPAHFPTTRWSLVLQAGDPNAPLARESLAELCSAYWYPLYAYIRRRGNGPEQASDLTQDFFARAIEKGLLAEANAADSAALAAPVRVRRTLPSSRSIWKACDSMFR